VQRALKFNNKAVSVGSALRFRTKERGGVGGRVRVGGGGGGGQDRERQSREREIKFFA